MVDGLRGGRRPVAPRRGGGDGRAHGWRVELVRARPRRRRFRLRGPAQRLRRRRRGAPLRQHDGVPHRVRRPRHRPGDRRARPRPRPGRPGLPPGAVSLVASPARSAGWALFSDPRLALAVARGSGPAVAQLGAVARQAGLPVSLHGTGGAWIVASAGPPIPTSSPRWSCAPSTARCATRSTPAAWSPPPPPTWSPASSPPWTRRGSGGERSPSCTCRGERSSRPRPWFARRRSPGRRASSRSGAPRCSPLTGSGWSGSGRTAPR